LRDCGANRLPPSQRPLTTAACWRRGKYMESLLLTAIEREAKKRLSKHSRNWYYIHKYRRTVTKRTGRRAKGGASTTPDSWAHHNHFDPRYFLNHSRFLAKGIWSALQNGIYQPVPSLRDRRTGGWFDQTSHRFVPFVFQTQSLIRRAFRHYPLSRTSIS
jgi:hypothetical protein